MRSYCIRQKCTPPPTNLRGQQIFLGQLAICHMFLMTGYFAILNDQFPGHFFGFLVKGITLLLIFDRANLCFLVMRNRMAVRAVVLGRFMQLPVVWTSYDGMVHLDCRFYGPLSGFILREAHSYWAEATVSIFVLSV